MAPVELDDAGSGDTLAEVLVGRADEDLLDPRVRARDASRRGQPVVRFQVDHGPYCDSHRGQGALHGMKLCPERRVDAGGALVSGPEIVSERFDHVIGGDPDMRHPGLQHPEERPRHAQQRTHLAARPVAARGDRVEMAEELVGAVDEVNVHGRAHVRTIR